MNFETTLFMNLGMVTGWAILSPLAKLNGWAPGPVSSSTNGARGWIVSQNFPRARVYKRLNDLTALSYGYRLP